MTRKIRLLAFLCLLNANPAGLGAQEASGPAVTFRFAPPDGATYIETLTTTKTRQRADGTTREDVIQGTVRVEIHTTEDGYRLEARTLSAGGSQDGEVVETPIFDALEQLHLTYHLTPDGRLRSLSGFEELPRRLAETLPPEMMKVLSRVLDPQVMAARERAEWEGRVTRLAGRVARPGEVWSGSAEFDLPGGGQITTFVATKLEGLVPCVEGGERRCALLRFSYDSDPARVGELVEEVAAGLARELGAAAAGIEVESVQLTGEGRRAVDPTTLLPYGESSQRAITVRIVTPDGLRRDIVQRETREYTFRHL